MGVATKISSDCIIYDDESDVSPHYQVILSHQGKQIRYYPPYLYASTIHEQVGPIFHVQELGASFVAVWELTSDSSLDDIKAHSAELREWVMAKTIFRLSENSTRLYIKQSNLFVPLSASYYWE